MEGPDSKTCAIMRATKDPSGAGKHLDGLLSIGIVLCHKL